MTPEYPIDAPSGLVEFFFFFLKDFIYYLVSREAGREREEEAGSPLSREPHVGLDPRTLGS